MAHVVIAVENLRIGGYQRLALDQAYYLSDSLQEATLLLLNPELPGIKTFEHTERDLIQTKNLNITRLTGRRIDDFFSIRKMLKIEHSEILIISHSLRSTVLFSLARIGSRKKVIVNTTIHQLPALSRFTQRTKRFLYSLFTDNLFAYSDAVSKDWKERYGRLGKKISVLRNGIYLDRIPKTNSFSDQNEVSRRLIFLGRNTSWKGIETFFHLFKSKAFVDFSGLMMISQITTEIEMLSKQVENDRISLVEGANLASFIPKQGDLHVYPAQYGIGAKFTEPISLNCLEMAAMGIRSLVSCSNEDTWPDLKSMGVFIPVDWNEINSEFSIGLKSFVSLTTQELEFICKSISIKVNVDTHLTFV